ncbi:hypothetical protein L1987_36410 [Smallanthus sonchifolius]|uniref:Uncharacterized protein n=1 Tax=Smallanthus sonchifolius TaxID=185202 RepID=A0ACB9HEQ9_9ASTR|nr:hypothetical protein L1987_36410 [Smallanthus sonchifolius]
MEKMGILRELLVGAQEDIAGKIMLIWGQMKVLLVVPFLRIFMYINLVMLIMLFIEKAYMALVVAINILFGKKPEQHYKWEPFEDDAELGSSVFPLVYRISIGAACRLSWPSDRIVIQVLDDSTDPLIKGMVQKECQSWESRGINIHYQVRDNRKGYKAGALKEGLKHHYGKECESKEESSRMQEMSIDYHFKVEQESGSITYAFFGFNGTAEVWRMAALDEAEGWKDRTTVEDMDLAVRASLKGWKFLYIGSLMVKNELASVFKAYRYQQHRWYCGPANLFRKMFFEIMRNKIVAYIVTFTLYCVVIPATVLIPEVMVPRSFYLVVFWFLFENVMSLHRTKVIFIGLFETRRVNERVVTEKQGDASKPKTTTQQSQSRFQIGERSAGYSLHNNELRLYWHSGSQLLADNVLRLSIYVGVT